jgi:hypothetical protein
MKPFGSLATRTRTTTHDGAGPENTRRSGLISSKATSRDKSNRFTAPEKLAEFKQAIANRDIVIRQAQLTPASWKKLAELGIELQQRTAS